MSDIPSIAVFVLMDESEDTRSVARTMTGLAADGGSCLTVEIVSPQGVELPDAVLRSPVWFSPPASAASVVNDWLLRESAGVLFFALSGSVVHPQDLITSARQMLLGRACAVTGRTYQVITPIEVVNHDELWRHLRENGPGNRLDVTQSSGLVCLLGMTREAYISLRGLDESAPDAATAISDLEERARRAGVDTAADPLVLRAARRLNALAPVRVSPLSPGERHVPTAPIYRNLLRGVGDPRVDPPLVSIVISTFNRAAYLGDCLNSILTQSMPDFEVILVDDGSTDNTEAVVGCFADERIRYFGRANVGISAARNFGLREARGTFVAVHDDDDIMLPWRLATQLAMLQPGDHGSFGISVHFDEVTGETHNLVHRLFNMQTALRYGNNPTHPTWLVRRDVMSAFGYDETLESGVDNNLALRMLRSGIRMRHCGVPLILRRVHTGQITRTAGETQKASAGMSRRMLQFANAGGPTEATGGAAGEWLPPTEVDDRVDRVRPFLPDHLVRRAVTLRITEPLTKALALAEAVGQLEFIRSRFGMEEDQGSMTVLTLTDVTWDGLAALRKAGAELEVTLVPEGVAGERALDSALENWSVDEVGSVVQEGVIFVRVISNARDQLDRFIRGTGLTGWAFLGMQRGEPRMAVLFEMPSLASAVSLCTELEGAGLDISEASILSPLPITDQAIQDTLMNDEEARE